MIWLASDVNENEKYRLHLCQSKDGKRFFNLVLIGIDADDHHCDEVAFISSLVPNSLLKRRDITSISESVLLDNGHPFFVDAHGFWLTESEVNEMDSGIGFNEIKWSTGHAPKFSPR